MTDIKNLIDELNGADLFLRDRADMSTDPLNDYDIMLFQEIAKACDTAVQTLEKAVIPPVDVGDKVWYINGGYYNSARQEPREIEVTEINKKKSGKAIEWAFIANRTRYKFSSIGKTVFLTKEECEAAINNKKSKNFKQHIV